jgi:hypothetical protein
MRALLLVLAFGSLSAFAQPMEAAPAAPLTDPGGRVRWGISADLGWHVPQSALTLGLEGRAG